MFNHSGIIILKVVNNYYILHIPDYLNDCTGTRIYIDLAFWSILKKIQHLH